jgi:hypothetical protein
MNRPMIPNIVAVPQTIIVIATIVASPALGPG